MKFDILIHYKMNNTIDSISIELYDEWMSNKVHGFLKIVVQMNTIQKNIMID